MNFITRVVTFALLLTANVVFAGADYYLEIEGIKGEAKGKVFQASLDKNGKATFPNLPQGTYQVKMCATGQHIKKAVLYGRKSGKEQYDYTKPVEMEIESFSWGMSNSSKGYKGGVTVASGDVTGDGAAASSHGSGGGGGAGKASFSDISFSVNAGGKSSSYGGGGGSGKVQMQDFHFTMQPASDLGPGMYRGTLGTITIDASRAQEYAGASFDAMIVQSGGK